MRGWKSALFLVLDQERTLEAKAFKAWLYNLMEERFLWFNASKWKAREKLGKSRYRVSEISWKKMTTLRRFKAVDLLRIQNINLDVFTENVPLSFAI